MESLIPMFFVAVHAWKLKIKKPHIIEAFLLD